MDLRRERPLTEAHASTTDPDAEARMVRLKGKESKLAYQGHVLIENRHDLVVDAWLTASSGTAEWEAALEMLETVGGLAASPPAPIAAAAPEPS